MHYTRKYSDNKSMFPALTHISKELLLSVCFDSSVSGSSYIRSVDAAIDICEKRHGDDVSCSKVYEKRREVVELSNKVSGLKKSGDASYEEENKKLQELRKEYEDIKSLVCSECKYLQNLTKKDTVKRLNLSRFGNKNVSTVANIKTIIGIHTLVPMTRIEDDNNGDLSATYVHLKVLGNLCNLSTKSIKRALSYWQDKGILIYSLVGDGTVLVSFTEEALNMKIRKSNEGGAGYVRLTFDAITALMSAKNLDVLRLGILTLINADIQINDQSAAISKSMNYYGNVYSFDGMLVKFVKRHKHCSLSNLIDRFNQAFNRLKEGYLIIDKSTYRIDITSNLLPKQSGSRIGLLCEKPNEVKAVMSDEFISWLNSFKNSNFRNVDAEINRTDSDKMFSSFSMAHGLLMEEGGEAKTKPYIKPEPGKIDKNVIPTTPDESLIPVITQIYNTCGAKIASDTLSNAILKFRKDISPSRCFGNDDSKNLVDSIKKYMLLFATRLRTSCFTTWKSFEADLR